MGGQQTRTGTGLVATAANTPGFSRDVPRRGGSVLRGISFYVTTARLL